MSGGVGGVAGGTTVRTLHWNPRKQKYQNTPYTPSLETTSLETPEQKAALAKLVTQMNSPAQAYTGPGVAENPYKSKITGLIDEYSASGMPSLYTAAQKELQDTLGGTTYDPSTGQYYQATRNAAQLNLSDAINAYNRSAKSRGMFTSTGADVGRSRLVAEMNNNLNSVLGQLSLQERQNRLSAVPTAMSVGSTIGQLPIAKAANISAAYAPVLAQDNAKAQFDYQEWLRRQKLPISMAQAVLDYTPAYATRLY